MATLLDHNYKLYVLCFQRPSINRRREAADSSRIPYCAKRVLLACSFCHPPRIGIGSTPNRNTAVNRRTLRRFEDDRKVSNSPNEEVEEDERPRFDINLAVILAGFAFESYNTPSDKEKTYEMDPFGCKTIFLSEEFLREVYDGQLLIHLTKGLQFPGLDLWGTSDPYVTLRVGDTIVRSKTIWATTEPVWNENFKINVRNSTAQYLQVAGWDANLVTNDRRLGNAGVNLDSLCDGKKHEVRVELEGMGGGGIVDLEVQYKKFSDIDADKEGWKIPLLSDLLMGKGLRNAIKETFGLDTLTSRDFVMSALGSLQLPPGDPKTILEKGSETQGNPEQDDKVTSGTMGITIVKGGESTLKEIRNNSEHATKLTVQGKSISEDTQQGKDLDLLDQKDRWDNEADFLAYLRENISRTLGAVSLDKLEIPLLNHVSWEGIDMIKKLGLAYQSKAQSEYVENGLALAMVKQDDSSSDESAAAAGLTPSTEDVKRASLNVLKQTEEILQSWAVLAAFLTGQRGRTEKVAGKTTAIITESMPVAPQVQISGSAIAPKETIRTAEEMEELRKMFNRTESAVEAWAVLAGSLGHDSFVKSAFEKICFLDNEKTDTQVAIWRDTQHHRLVVAFRGTEQVKWKDLRTDLLLLPVGFNPERVGGDFKEEAMVHGGFLHAYDSVRNKLMSLVRASVTSSDNEADTKCQWHVFVTGHSLGGALATLFALELTACQLSRDRNIKVTMYNFGSPRVGNKKFADRYNERVKDSWRVVNHRDIIPTVPRLMGYCHVAQPVYLTAGDVFDATVNMELVEDGYHGDVIGEATPEFLVEEFMKGEKQLIERLFQTEIAMLRALRDGSALMQHMEDFYYISLLERVTPRYRLMEADDKKRLKA